MSFLRLKTVSKSYGTILAVDEVSFEVPEGSQTVIVGPSASGKSTLLRLIAGFEEPNAGEVMLDNTLLAGNGKMLPAHRRGIGLVAQDGALFPHLTVGGNVAFGMQRSDPERSAQVSQLLQMVGLDASLAARRPDQLSGGQQQRVAIARALARRPRLMLLDEPFSALDTNLRIATRKAIIDVLKAANITTVLVTHDQAEALSFADYLAVMQNSRLAQFGKPRELYDSPKTPQVATYLGDAILLPATVSRGYATCELGRLRVNNLKLDGPVQIMLRPEQIQLTEITGSVVHDADSCEAEIVAVNFTGGVSDVTVRLISPAGSPPLMQLVIKQPTSSLHRPGCRVSLTMAGHAHAFAAA